MSLVRGAPIGAYTILDLIGVGGTGEVYRAQGTRLVRDVAIEFPAEKFSAIAEFSLRDHKGG